VTLHCFKDFILSKFSITSLNLPAWGLEFVFSEAQGATEIKNYVPYSFFQKAHMIKEDFLIPMTTLDGITNPMNVLNNVVTT
jgi:hypothetical protein